MPNRLSLRLAAVLLAVPMAASAGWSGARFRVTRARDLSGMMLSRTHSRVVPNVVVRMLRRGQGPLCVLTAGGKTAVLPKVIESDSQAALVGGNGDIAWLTLTFDNAAKIRRHVKRQEIDKAIQAAATQFDGR